MEKLKVVFAGTGSFGKETLEKLISDPNITIPLIITAPDKASGRKLKVLASAIKQTAIKNKLIVQQPERIEELLQKLIQLQPDILLVVAYGQLIPLEILNVPKIAAINIHASLLPKYRGASPIQEAILHGDRQTGITWIKMAEKLDAGDVIAQREVVLDEDDTYEDLSKKLSSVAANNTNTILAHYAHSPSKKKQDELKASFCRKIKKEDGKIDFTHEEAINIVRKIKAYTPWPGCYTMWNGKRLKILKATLVEQKNDSGKVIKIEKAIIIGTLNGSLHPILVQPESKRAMSIEDFIQGQKDIPLFL